MQPAVVDAVEAALDAVVLAADAGEELAVVVAQRHEEAVHAVVHAAGDELREDRGGLAVQRRVAEVVLPRAAERRVDHELLGVGVVGRRRADRRDIRSVPRLGHREGAGDLQVHDARQPLVVVLLRAELVDGRAEQAPLHAGLDLQAGIGEHELHEAREVRAVVTSPAVLLGDRATRCAVLDEQVQLAEDALAVLGHRHAVDAPERRVLDHLARFAPSLGPGAEEQIGHRRDIDAGLGCLGRGVRSGGRAAGRRALARGGFGGADCGVGHACHLSASETGKSLLTVGLPQHRIKAAGGCPQRKRPPRRRRLVRDAQAGSRGWRAGRDPATMEPESEDGAMQVTLERWGQDDLEVLRRANSPEMTRFLGGPESPG